MVLIHSWTDDSFKFRLGGAGCILYSEGVGGAFWTADLQSCSIIASFEIRIIIPHSPFFAACSH